MNTASIWKGTSEETDFPALTGDLSVDVAIIGGGITGITAALLLSQAGKSVAVLEAGKLGMGTTGFSTGNLYAVLAEHLFTIGEKWDEATMRAVADARQGAVDLIEKIITTHAIDCDFFRRPLHLFAADAAEERKGAVEKEYQAAVTIGLKARLTETLPSPFKAEKALIIEEQAQFHPLNYVKGLAQAIADERCQIFEHSKAIAIDDSRCIVDTAGGSVTAGKIIMATHTPKGVNVLQTELGPYREYAIAARLDGNDFPEGIFWSLGPSRHSIRSYDSNGHKYLLVLGEDHKTGQKEETGECYQRLEEYLRANFAAGAIEYRWSAQRYYPADKLPYIGKSIGSANVYVATGYATDGLVYGTLAAVLISDDIMGRENPCSGLFDSRRFNPAKSAKEFLTENINVAGYYLKDYLKGPETHSADEVGRGEGKLIKLNGEKLAAYRDDNGKLFLLSPVCTHMKCIVHWNKAERTWDCPCHGSRFQFDGEVIEGPAIAALESKSLESG